jgi:putative transposase
MFDEMKQKIALFRFQVISPLLSISKLDRGQKEKVLNELVSKEWEIPDSGRTYIGRSTILEWLSIYEKSGRKLESLYPRCRNDIGKCRSIDTETQLGLVNLKKQYPTASIPSIIKMAYEQKIILPEIPIAHVTVYRILKRNDLIHQEASGKKDRRKFETELSNDLWQSDCLHGPMVKINGKLKKSFLFAFIDDHSRLIPHAQFFQQENLHYYMECLLIALCKRGIPRKLYVDNGPYFRSHRLQFTCASLGISLIYAKPYQPEGKGKIERWFRTVRMQFLGTVNDGISLEELNKRFDEYVNKIYHLSTHSSTGECPLQRYTRHVTLLRTAPKNIRDYFRNRARRKVENDRTVSLSNKLFEAPINMIGKFIDLLWHDSDPDSVEAFYAEKSLGYIPIVDQKVNSRIKRERTGDYEMKEEEKQLKSGTLFGKRRNEQ